MNTTLSLQPFFTPVGMDQVLQNLVAGYGYDQVLDRLNAAREALNREEEVKTPRFPTAREILALPAEEQDRLLSAAVDAALPLYEADLALPPHERELTADMETGEIYDYDEEDEHDQPQ